MRATLSASNSIDVNSNGESVGLNPGCNIDSELSIRSNLQLSQADIAEIKNLAATAWTPAVIESYCAPVHVPTQAEQFAEIERAFDKHIDNVAAARGYGRNGISPVAPSEACKGFAGYPNPWQAEAIKFAQWSADCCALLIQGQQDVIAGARPMPTPDQAIAELPTMVW